MRAVVFVGWRIFSALASGISISDISGGLFIFRKKFVYDDVIFTATPLFGILVVL